MPRAGRNSVSLKILSLVFFAIIMVTINNAIAIWKKIFTRDTLQKIMLRNMKIANEYIENRWSLLEYIRKILSGEHRRRYGALWRQVKHMDIVF